MSEFDWEEAALQLLEINLNGHSLNQESLKNIFSPTILEQLDIQDDGSKIDDLDKALYGGRPQIIETREAKPTEIYHCKACNRNFKRGDNFRRHLASNLHERRQRAMELAAMEKSAENTKV